MGFCVTIIITFGNTPEDELPFYYDSEEEKVYFYAKLISDENGNDKVELYLPLEIASSAYHEAIEFDSFNVIEDSNYGDVTFLEGEYPLQVTEEAYIYTIDIQIND